MSPILHFRVIGTDQQKSSTFISIASGLEIFLLTSINVSILYTIKYIFLGRGLYVSPDSQRGPWWEKKRKKKGGGVMCVYRKGILQLCLNSGALEVNAEKYTAT
jgi:hypothetical protein